MPVPVAISLVICTRNRSNRLGECLRRLRALRCAHRFELVLVNNGSTDDTAQVLASFAEASQVPCKVLEEPRPGLGRARNRGWRAAAGTLIAFTDDDCYPALDYLDRVLECFADPGIGYVGGRILLFDPKDQPITIQLLDRRVHLPSRSFIAAGLIQGANFAFRRAVLEAIDGFDDDLGPGTPFVCDDVDALARASAAGWKGLYHPAPTVYHHHRRRTAAEARRLAGTYDDGRGAYYVRCLLSPPLRAVYLRGWVKRLLFQDPRRTLREFRGGLHYLLRDAPVPGEPCHPRAVRLETATVCQLRCPSCPTTHGKIARHLGAGHLPLREFQAFVDRNPQIEEIELSNWGEILLNPDLAGILAYAHERRVTLHAGNGVNLNTLTDEVAEAMVRYRFRFLLCSIDGATQEIYGIYRRRGDLAQVLANIRKINRYKHAYRSRYPLLAWQMVIFGHNEHEIAAARNLAQELGMEFQPKLSWDELYSPRAFSPIRDRALVARETGLGVASRSEYRSRFGKPYLQKEICAQLWHGPQINFDGRVLGCCVNYWSDFGNAFRDGLTGIVNGEKMTYARGMLLGQRPPRDDIPCTTCSHYRSMQQSGDWLTSTALRRADAMKWVWTRLHRVEDKIRAAIGVFSRLTRPGRRGVHPPGP